MTPVTVSVSHSSLQHQHAHQHAPRRLQDRAGLIPAFTATLASSHPYASLIPHLAALGSLSPECVPSCLVTEKPTERNKRC